MYTLGNDVPLILRGAGEREAEGLTIEQRQRLGLPAMPMPSMTWIVVGAAVLTWFVLAPSARRRDIDWGN